MVTLYLFVLDTRVHMSVSVGVCYMSAHVVCMDLIKLYELFCFWECSI